MFKDKQRILEIIKVIKTNLKYIQVIDLKNIKKTEDNIKDYYFVSMALFTILNKIIELAEEIVDELNIEKYPSNYFQFFDILFEEKIIHKDLLKKLKVFVEYRNDIAHEYSDIGENEIKWCVKNLNVIEDFLKIVKNLF